MGDTLDKPYESVTEEEKETRLRYQIMDAVQQTRWILISASSARWTGSATCTTG